MPEATSAAEAVKNGAALLDEKSPGWWQKIDISDFDITNCSSCICGQLARYEYDGVPNDWRRYEKFVVYLGGAMDSDAIASDFEVAHGFFAPDNEAWDWDQLDSEWTTLIQARQLGSSKVARELVIA